MASGLVLSIRRATPNKLLRIATDFLCVSFFFTLVSCTAQTEDSSVPIWGCGLWGVLQQMQEQGQRAPQPIRMMKAAAAAAATAAAAAAVAHAATSPV